MSEVRLIDANAYAAEMKERQDTLKEMIDAAVKDDNWELYDKLSRSFGVFVEAKLTLDNMPTVDAVPVCRCCDCKYCYKESDYEYWCGGNGFPMRLVTAEDYCSRGKRKEITL